MVEGCFEGETVDVGGSGDVGGDGEGIVFVRGEEKREAGRRDGKEKQKSESGGMRRREEGREMRGEKRVVAEAT